MTTPSSGITKIGGACPARKAFVILKTGSLLCFSCKLDILWADPGYKIGAICVRCLFTQYERFHFTHSLTCMEYITLNLILLLRLRLNIYSGLYTHLDLPSCFQLIFILCIRPVQYPCLHLHYHEQCHETFPSSENSF